MCKVFCPSKTFTNYQLHLLYRLAAYMIVLMSETNNYCVQCMLNTYLFFMCVLIGTNGLFIYVYTYVHTFVMCSMVKCSLNQLECLSDFHRCWLSFSFLFVNLFFRCMYKLSWLYRQFLVMLKVSWYHIVLYLLHEVLEMSS